MKVKERCPSGRRCLIRNQVDESLGSSNLPPSAKSFGSTFHGEVTERPKVHDWKSCVSQGTEGSNPSPSAPLAGPSGQDCVILWSRVTRML